MKEVKIVWVEKNNNDECEEALTKLVNEGWQIVAAGGGRGAVPQPVGFVVLQRKRE